MSVRSRIERLTRMVPVNFHQWAQERRGRDGVIVLTDAEALAIAESVASGELTLELAPPDDTSAPGMDCSQLSDYAAVRLKSVLPPELIIDGEGGG